VIISDPAGLTTDIRVQVYISCKYIDGMNEQLSRHKSVVLE